VEGLEEDTVVLSTTPERVIFETLLLENPIGMVLEPPPPPPQEVKRKVENTRKEIKENERRLFFTPPLQGSCHL